MVDKLKYSRFFIPSKDTHRWYQDLYGSAMSGVGSPKLLTVEEKWQIIFNEKTRAPIYTVTHYLEYLTQFLNGESAASRDSSDVIKKDGINPMSYLLRKLKLDLKMSYESFLDEFLKPGNNGIGILVKLLKSIQIMGSQQSGSSNLSQLKSYKRTLTDEHDCLLCIKYAMRSRSALPMLLDITYGLETVAMGLMSTFTKSRGTAIEILTVALSATDGFSRVLDCFTHIRLKIGEPLRFKSLMNMMNLDSQQNILFKVSCMKFLNSLLKGCPTMNTRVFLQHELETAGFDIISMEQRASGTGLEYDDLRGELLEWRRKYIDVESIVNFNSITAQPSQQDPAQQTQKYLNRTGKHSGKVQISIDTENKIMQSRELGGNNAMKMICLQYTLAVKHKLNKQMQEYVIEELSRELQLLKTENTKVESKLKAASSELRLWYEEQRRRQNRSDVGIQAGSATLKCTEVECQCNLIKEVDPWGNPLRTAAEFFGWQDTGGPQENDAVHYSEHKHKLYHQMANDSDDGVEKVNHWLSSHYESSDSELDLLPQCFREDAFSRHRRGYERPSKGNIKYIYYPRNNQIPVNWSFAPKFSGQFPSRFQEGQCHKTSCDRCQVGNKSKKTDKRHVKRIPVPLIKLRPDSKSQSSDSALGGSGERLWNGRDGRIPLLPAEEAELLQDLIQPDDSASGVPPGEPCPDYSSIDTSKFETQKSYNAELSKILKEFEVNLDTFDGTKQRSGSYRKSVGVANV